MFGYGLTYSALYMLMGGSTQVRESLQGAFTHWFLQGETMCACVLWSLYSDWIAFMSPLVTRLLLCHPLVVKSNLP